MGWQAEQKAPAVRWKINVGPLPVVVRHQADQDEEWAWRVSNRDHITVVIVRIARDVLEAEKRGPMVDDVIDSKGWAAVKGVMHWGRPPREIRYADAFSGPTYWGGQH